MRNVDNAAEKSASLSNANNNFNYSPPHVGPTQPFIASHDVQRTAVARTYGLRLKLIFLPLGSGKSQKRFRRS